MIRSASLTLLILILEQYPVHALYSQIIKRIVVNDLDFECWFDLSYSETEVDLVFSSVTCDGYSNYATDTIENVEVVLSAPNGYEFSGVITIYMFIPQIVSMVIDNAVTEPLRPTEFYCPYDKLEIFDGAKPSDDNKSYVMISHYKHSLIPLIFRLSVELS